MSFSILDFNKPTDESKVIDIQAPSGGDKPRHWILDFGLIQFRILEGRMKNTLPPAEKSAIAEQVHGLDHIPGEANGSGGDNHRHSILDLGFRIDSIPNFDSRRIYPPRPNVCPSGHRTANRRTAECRISNVEGRI